MMNRQELYKKAKHRVNLKKGFFIHLMLFCGVVPILFLVNFIFTPGFWWFLIAFAGWGLGVFIHFMVIYGFLGEKGQRWEALQIEKEIDRLLLLEDLKQREENILNLSEYNRPVKDRETIKKEWRDEDFV